MRVGCVCMKLNKDISEIVAALNLKWFRKYV